MPQQQVLASLWRWLALEMFGEDECRRPPVRQADDQEDTIKRVAICACMLGLVIVAVVVAFVWGTSPKLLPEEEVQRRIDILSRLIGHETLPPFWLESLKIPITVLINYLVFCRDILHTTAHSASSIEGRIWLAGLRLLFIVLVLNCAWFDYDKISTALQEIASYDKEQAWPYSIWVSLVGVVMSPNYVHACAIWLLLVRLSPCGFFSHRGFRDPITAWSMVYKWQQGEEVEEYQHEALLYEEIKPRYLAAPCTGGVPVCPGAARWLQWDSHLYALVLFPYYVFTALQVSALRLGCCTLSCCKACWCSLGWGILATLSLFCWGHAREQLQEEGSRAWPLFQYFAIVIWASLACSLVSFLSSFFIYGVSCTGLTIHKRFRLIFALPQYLPTLLEDFYVDAAMMDQAKDWEKEFLSTDSDADDDGFSMDGEVRVQQLGAAVHCKVFMDSMFRATQVLIMARIFVLASVTYHTFKLSESSATDGTPFLDALSMTISNRTMSSYLGSQSAQVHNIIHTNESGAYDLLLLIWSNL